MLARTCCSAISSGQKLTPVLAYRRERLGWVGVHRSRRKIAKHRGPTKTGVSRSVSQKSVPVDLTSQLKLSPAQSARMCLLNLCDRPLNGLMHCHLPSNRYVLVILRSRNAPHATLTPQEHHSLETLRVAGDERFFPRCSPPVPYAGRAPLVSVDTASCDEPETWPVVASAVNHNHSRASLAMRCCWFLNVTLLHVSMPRSSMR